MEHVIRFQTRNIPLEEPLELVSQLPPMVPRVGDEFTVQDVGGKNASPLFRVVKVHHTAECPEGLQRVHRWVIDVYLEPAGHTCQLLERKP